MFLITSLVGRYGRDVASGISKYCAQYGRWEFYLEPDFNIAVRTIPETLRLWRPDGIIAHIANPKLRDLLLRAGVPTVNTSSSLDLRSIPTVAADNPAVGRVAAEYFLQRGHRNFAYAGDSRAYSCLRKDGFITALRGSGLECDDFEGGYSFRRRDDWMRLRAALREWVMRLPKPVAIMGCSDLMGREIIIVSQQLHALIPDEVAVVGVDNDEIFCGMLNPPLSSVDVPAERIGYEAAALLHRMIKGCRPPRDAVLVPPVGVVVRPSSEVLEISDEAVAQSVKFIAENAHEPISVKDLLGHVLVSRRSLERAFASILSRTPREEIIRAHVERAKHLLLTTDLPVSAVAKASGFTSPSIFSTVMRRTTGMTPLRYRSQFRVPAPVSAQIQHNSRP